MTRSNIYVTIVRPGKDAQTVEIAAGSSVEAVFLKAGLREYASWHLTDEDGDVLSLTDTIENSTQLIAGPRVDGA